MKKALKYIMLALLIIPCSLVFTACSETLTPAKFTRVVFDAYNKQIVTETYETWADVNVKLKETASSNGTVKLTYYDRTGIAEPEKTEEFPSKQVITSTTTFARTGTGKDTVIRYETKEERTINSYRVDEQKKLETINTSRVVNTIVYVGRVGGEYVVTKTTKTTTMEGSVTTVDDTLNQKETLADEDAFKEALNHFSEEFFIAGIQEAYETVTPIVDSILDRTDKEVFLGVGYADLMDCRYTKEDEIFTATGKIENMAMGLDSLYNGEVTLKCGENKLYSYSLDLDVLQYSSSGWLNSGTAQTNLDFKYETIKITMPNTTGYTAGTNLVPTI